MGHIRKGDRQWAIGDRSLISFRTQCSVVNAALDTECCVNYLREPPTRGQGSACGLAAGQPVADNERLDEREKRERREKLEMKDEV